MPRIPYITKRFNRSSQVIIAHAIEIIEEYASAGFDLTLRQLYYQFVARDLLMNKDSEYKRLGGIINDARLAGYIDWGSIVDRTRFIRGNPHWNSPRDIIESCASQYRIDTRNTQDNYVEVWIEKDALVGVITNVCTDLDVPYFSCRGYVSQSAMWRAGIRMYQQEESGKEVTVYHLGDHDPSGIDMTRDIQDRLLMFGAIVDVRRIALTMEQIEELNPPPNPAKLSDSRCMAYISQYGNESWELDALEPSYIVDLIRDKVMLLTDKEKWTKQCDIQDRQRKVIQEIADGLD